ncbi:TIGR02677 family protein [Catellatospora bangladeshensis]|uniref:TIGR02677 family protein n=1 Tax=Catellatospora bangladeshensis TaxID=310355 RepID=A0A8J3JNX4_9ACTN|nr:TIGR02677 family protein [Catellatospora bangladeshensis]GIF85874.1 hypothetical protein Cba03nite_72230 [Catellatospora bangladeshensis]
MADVASDAVRPFAHLQSEHADRYRLVLAAFTRAKDRFVVHLRPEDVHADLGHLLDLDGVTNGLAQLTTWGNLRADPDTGRVTTPEDFNRARYLYQLTSEGEAAEQAIAVYEEAVGRRGVLQSVALTDIASQLHALLHLLKEANDAGTSADAAKAHLLLLSIVERFASLADNAQAFMASLRRTIDFADSDVDAFVAYKERLITYIERFIADLANQGAEIARLAHEVEAAGVRDVLDAAARREAADAVPDADSDTDAYALTFTVALDRWRARWDGLRSWFVSADARRPSQAKLLRSAAIASITQLLATVSAINDRRSGRSDRSADFRRLAVWFAEATDDDAHRLWRAAFAMSSARHLSVTPATTAVWDEQRVPSSTPWREAPALRISPQLRRTGSYERRGTPNRVADRSEQRRFLAERAARESAQTAAARAELATDGPVLLSQLAELDPLAFRLFLQLLGDALAARGRDGAEVRVTSSDGTMRVRLTPVPHAPEVAIRTADGVLQGPEHLIDIAQTGPAGDN